MKITLSQHGGPIAAFNRRRPPQIVESPALDEPQAAELKGLAAAASSAPPPTPSGKARDEIHYTHTIQDQGRETVQ